MRALLIVLGASFSIFSAASCERYLMIWVAGWIAFLASRLIAAHGSRMLIPQRYVCRWPKMRRSLWPWDCLPPRYWALHTSAHPRFTLSSRCDYLKRHRDLPLPAHCYAGPDIVPLHIALGGRRRRIILLAGTFGLDLRACWGTAGVESVGALALGLLSMHLDWPPFTTGLPGGLFLAADLTLGLSVLLVVFEEARRPDTAAGESSTHSTHNIACAQQSTGPVLQTCFARATEVGPVESSVRVRLLEGGHMVVRTMPWVFLREFLRDAGLAEMRRAVARDSGKAAGQCRRHRPGGPGESCRPEGRGTSPDCDGS